MAAVITPEQAAKQASEIQAPAAAPKAPEAPKSAAAGTHPGAPIESDSEVLAEWQGAREARGVADVGRWSLDAWNRPVFIKENPPAAGGRASRTSGEPLEIPPTLEEKPAAPRGREK